MNIKIISLKDQILLLLQLGDEDISRLASSHLSSHFRSLIMYVQNFYPKVESFTKNGDKFGWVKYCMANDIQFVKFAKVFPHHNFVLYSITIAHFCFKHSLHGCHVDLFTEALHLISN